MTVTFPKYYRDAEQVMFESGLGSGSVIHNQIRALIWIRFCSAGILWPNLKLFCQKWRKFEISPFQDSSCNFKEVGVLGKKFKQR